MPQKKSNNPSIKDQDKYEALREKGMSKEKAARISNAGVQADEGEREQPSKKGGEAAPYEDWKVDELRKRAAEIGIPGRAGMNKQELIEALRNH